MGKALPIVGIVAAVLAGFFVGNVTPSEVTPFIGTLLLLAAALACFFEKGARSKAFGGVLVLASLVPLLFFTVNGIQRNGQEVFPDAGPFLRIQALPIACLLPVLWAAYSRRERFEPPWVEYVAYGLAAAVALVAILIPAGDYGHTTVMSVLGGILALGLVWPMVVLLRAPPERLPAPAPAAPSPRPPSPPPPSSPTAPRKPPASPPRGR